MGASSSRALSAGAALRVPSLALVAFLPTSLGFVRKAWAFGYGYALSLGLGGAFLTATAPLPLPRAAALSALGASAHGVRLALYLFARERRGGMPEEYKRRVAALEGGDTSPLGRAKRLPLLASCAGMYALLMAPLALALRRPDEDESLLTWAGVALQWAGALTAALADWQKHASKRHRPDHWCDTGLYRYSRHPNYAGELMLWSGTFLAGARSYRGAGEWATAGAGLAAAWATMLGATRRLDAKQAAHYAGMPAHGAYVSSTGALAPRMALRMPRFHRGKKARGGAQ